MADFSHILLAVDFDRTITAPDGSVPERNLRAIRSFMEQGGAFTVATGRSIPMFAPRMDAVPVNAPMLLYNGAACYDRETGQLSGVLDLPGGRETIRRVMEEYPDLCWELQGLEVHYLFGENSLRDAFYRENGAKTAHAEVETVPGPFWKIAAFGTFRDTSVAQFFTGDPDELRAFRRIREQLARDYGDQLSVDLAAPRIIDVQHREATKGKAARALGSRLGRRILVCAGDAPNDLSMLREADLAFVPGDCDPAVAAEGFPAVCPCAQGSVADVVVALGRIFGR